MYIGENPSGVVQQFTGTIDEVRVWNVAHTQSQIAASMYSELSGTESGLVAYYNFNQGVAGGTNTTITSLADVTSNANNASISNFTLTGNASNFVDGPTLTPVTVVTAIVHPLPTVASSVDGSLICGTGTTSLSAAASAGAKIDWYAASTGGTALITGSNTYTTPTISATTVYYAEARDTVTGCVSATRTAVTAMVGALPTAGLTNNTGSTLLTCSRTAISVTATGGASYVWSSSLGSSAAASITSPGTYTVTAMAANSCVATASVTITQDIATSTGDTTASACNTFEWYGNTYINSGTPTHTLTNGSGCDSVVTLHLTIRYSNTGSSSATANNSYTWTGTTYTISGTYTKTLTNNASCDSMHTLSLTINYSNTGSSSLTTCDTYTWNGTTYAASGSYIYTYTNVANADSVHTLSLTINYSNTGSSSATACDTYTWSGSTYTTSGTYTKTLTNAAGCDSVHTLSLTINYSTSSSVTVSQLGCYTWALNAVTYTVSGNYSLTYTNAIACDSIVTLYLTITPGVYLNAKAILSGPYVTAAALMHDSLRVNGFIPTTEPYTSSPYNKTAIGGSSGETVSNAILNVSGSNAIVDWVFIELRDAASNGTVVANKRALIQRDGDIVSSTDGTSPVYFPTVANGNYYVSVKHRNHLGVMSLNAISFSGCSTSSIDFTTSDPVYTMLCANPAQRKQIGSVYALWAGDANNNKNVKYNGLSNDKDALIYVLGISTPNNTVSRVYRMEDVNLDGKIRYNNTDNDRVIILNNVGVSTPNNVYFQHTPN